MPTEVVVTDDQNAVPYRLLKPRVHMHQSSLLNPHISWCEGFIFAEKSNIEEVTTVGII